eukprot:5082397-Alexandrium_andersonii.AAC.1
MVSLPRKDEGPGAQTRCLAARSECWRRCACGLGRHRGLPARKVLSVEHLRCCDQAPDCHGAGGEDFGGSHSCLRPLLD